MFRLPFRREHALILFFIVGIIASVFAYIQSQSVTPLVDYSYQVENAYRIFLGQMPYRDFFLVLPPGTYIAMAMVMFFTQGYSHVGQFILVSVVTIATIVTTGMLLLEIGVIPWVSVVLVLPLLFVGHVIYPWPLYDIFATATILFSLVIFVWSLNNKAGLLRWVLVGIVATIPSYFKQNIGLAFVGGMVIIQAITLLRLPSKKLFLRCLSFCLGAGISYGIFFLFLRFTNTWELFYYQLFTFATKVRTPAIALEVIRGEYLTAIADADTFLPILLLVAVPQILGTLFLWFGKGKKYRRVYTLIKTIVELHAIVVAYLLIIGVVGTFALHPVTEPDVRHGILYVWVAVYALYGLTLPIRLLLVKETKELFLSLLPLPLIIAAHAVYLSHHIVGSSYGIWPLYVLVLGSTVAFLLKYFRWSRIPFVALSGVLCTAVICYFFLKGQYFYSYIWKDGVSVHATLPKLRGLSSPGPWIKDFENLVTVTNTVIPKDAIVANLPGEDPFFAVTGRVNPMPYSQLHVQTFPVDYPNIGKQLATYDVEWVIAKTRWQLLPIFGLIDASVYTSGLYDYYSVFQTIPSYIILKKK
jgi:hypothetical protein